MNIKDHLAWAKTMLSASKETRKKWVKTIIDGIKSYRGKKSSEDSVWLSDMIQNKDEWELIGFAINQQYIRATGDAELLDAIWVHPWGTPNLLYKHKKLPVIITVGAGIRWNDSILGEIEKNEYDDSVAGFTG